MEEKLIDLMWEVKEGKKHPNRAYKELCVLFDVMQQSELFICSNCSSNWGEIRNICFNCGVEKDISK